MGTYNKFEIQCMTTTTYQSRILVWKLLAYQIRKMCEKLEIWSELNLAVIWEWLNGRLSGNHFIPNWILTYILIFDMHFLPYRWIRFTQQGMAFMASHPHSTYRLRHHHYIIQDHRGEVRKALLHSALSSEAPYH